jgi:hypothetical protein
MKNTLRKVLLILILAALVAGGVFAQTNSSQVRTTAFNGNYSGGVSNTGNPQEMMGSTTGGIRFNGSSVRGTSITGRNLSISARIQGNAGAITYDGQGVGSWFYLYSSGAKIGVAAYLTTGDYFLFFGAAAVRDGLEGATLAGYSASGMGTTYEGTLVKGNT